MTLAFSPVACPHFQRHSIRNDSVTVEAYPERDLTLAWCLFNRWFELWRARRKSRVIWRCFVVWDAISSLSNVLLIKENVYWKFFICWHDFHCCEAGAADVSSLSESEIVFWASLTAESVSVFRGHVKWGGRSRNWKQNWQVGKVNEMNRLHRGHWLWGRALALGSSTGTRVSNKFYLFSRQLAALEAFKNAWKHSVVE